MHSTVSDPHVSHAMWSGELVLRAAQRGEVSLVLDVLHIGARPASDSEQRQVWALLDGGYVFDAAGVYLATQDGRELLARWSQFAPLGVSA